MKLKKKINLTLIFIYIPINLILSIFLLKITRNHLTNRFHEKNQALLESAKEHLNQTEKLVNNHMKNSFYLVNNYITNKPSLAKNRELLIKLRDKSNVSHIYIIDQKGIIELTTNVVLNNNYIKRDHYKTFSIFDVCPNYRSLMESKITTILPIMWLRGNDIPAKFIMGWNPKIKKIVEISFNSNFIEDILKAATGNHKNILFTTITTPSGHLLGKTDSDNNIYLNVPKVENINSTNLIINGPNYFEYTTQVGTPHKNCEAISKKLADKNSLYYYLLTIRFSKNELNYQLKNISKLIIVLSASSFIIFLLVTYISINRILKNLETIKKFISTKMKNYHSSTENLFLNSNDETSEFGHFISKAINKIKFLEQEIAGLEKNKALNEVAFQVSHDIRSPLTALDITIKDLKTIPEDKRQIIFCSITRIKDIANNLLNKRRNFNHPIKEKIPLGNQVKNSFIFNLIESVVSEKRIFLKKKIDPNINFKVSTTAYDAFSKVDPNEFKSILSNLFNNSIEAISKKNGYIRISLSKSTKDIKIYILDNGSGIPKHLISKIGKKGATFNKSDGNGLGIYHAIKFIENGAEIFI